MSEPTEYAVPQRISEKPTAMSLVRPDVSGLEAPQHAIETQRHAEKLGYDHLYTVRPPADHPDPIGYALGMAAGLGVDALFVYDLATVDNMPSRICEMFDLETVYPPETWAAAPDVVDRDHTYPDHPLTVDEARRIMQEHIGCRAVSCPRKSSAYGRLVREGKIVPPVDTQRERAAARGIPYRPSAEPFAPLGTDLQTLIAVLDGLVADAEEHAFAVRLSPGSEG
ncbi:hypothetical protein [Nocardia wallacei]|uniref:hypothetical protein n=1 Tax=Nocardia wallacei TaxID=480035 RepID=UPI0024538BA0|nr:hypothetical protein [Nocardia wallacei]